MSDVKKGIGWFTLELYSPSIELQNPLTCIKVSLDPITTLSKKVQNKTSIQLNDQENTNLSCSIKSSNYMKSIINTSTVIHDRF